VFTSGFSVIISLLIDLVNAWVDPRVRY